MSIGYGIFKKLLSIIYNLQSDNVDNLFISERLMGDNHVLTYGQRDQWDVLKFGSSKVLKFLVRSGAMLRGDFLNHNGHDRMHNGHYFSFVSVVKTIVSIVVKHNPRFLLNISRERGAE